MRTPILKRLTTRHTNFLLAVMATAVTSIIMAVGCSEEGDDGIEPTPTYKLTTAVNPVVGGTVLPSATSSYNENELVTVIASASDGYEFNGWTGNVPSGVNVSDSVLTFPITNNVTLMANFKLKLIDNNNDGDDNDDKKSLPTPPAFGDVVKAMPVAASDDPKKPKIIGSWAGQDTNYYVIDVGYIEKIFVSEIASVHYIGFPMAFKRTSTESENVTRNMTTTVSSSIVVSTGTTDKVTLDAAIKAKIKVVEFSLGDKLETTNSVNVTDSKSTTTSATEIVSRTTTLAEELSFTIGNSGEEIGHYRYALYATSDVYFVLATSENNEELFNWGVISCVRPNTIVPHWVFSPDGNFDNSPITGNEIEFDENFFKDLAITDEIKSGIKYTIQFDANGGSVMPAMLQEIGFGTTVAKLSLPIPKRDGADFKGWYSALSGGFEYDDNHTITSNLTFYARWARTATKTYATNGSHEFNEGFPATVEIWAAGAGGGGAGGSGNLAWCGIIPCEDHILGAAGGGGAVTYAKFNIERISSFNVTIGSGGGGGARKDSPAGNGWNYGEDGKAGGASQVIVSGGKSVTITANGGEPGRGGTGGNGGEEDSNPGDLLDHISKPGSRGGDGAYGENSKQPSPNAGGIGGSGLPIPNSTVMGGSGGNGGMNGNGGNGGNGQVIIVVTYEEVL